MPARKASLRDLAAKTKKDGLAAANTPTPATNRIVELDPDLVHAAGLQDRLEIDEAKLEFLVESIRTMGQKVPIIVRPHPEIPGHYEIVAGRRRLTACKRAELPVRAEIQDIEHRDLVLGQVVENVAREDLTFIERARLAVQMTEAGYQGAEIDAAFGCGKSERSRYLKVGRTIPGDVVAWIGRAPTVGRPRWETLADHIERDDPVGILDRIREAIGRPDATDAADRFDYVVKAALKKDAPARPSTRRDEVELRWRETQPPLGTMPATPKGVQITLPRDRFPELVDWVAVNPEALAKILMEGFMARRPAESEKTEAEDEPR